MNAGKDNRNEKIEILCPCGKGFETVRTGERGEYPCPSCGRIHVLLGNDVPRKGETSKKGKTTVPVSPAFPDIRTGERLGPYEVTGFIGEGGMGRVYAAEDTGLKRKVALKVLSHQLLDKKDFVARFEREARAIARLNHPEIVQIYFTGVHEGMPYYAMEMVSGGSLESLKSQGKLSPDRATELLRQAARGLSAAQAQGVIHRDIKPSNLMLDTLGRLKITDFGLAKTIEIDSAITHTGTIIGTPYYMSPEQGEGRSLDERSDIYSLGATFYHLLAGSPPFDAESPIGVILKHIHEEPPSLRSRNPEVPEALARIIEKMMAKSPEDRYQGYGPLIEDLNALEAGLPPGAALEKRYRKKRRTDSATSESSQSARGSSFVVLDRDRLDGFKEVMLKRCGLIRRLLALVLDFSVLFVLYWLYASRYSAAEYRDGMHTFFIPADPLSNSLFLLIAFLYFFLGDARGGMTLGKVLLRCRVGRQDGQNIGFKSSLARTLFLFPLFMAPGVLRLEQPFDSYLKVFFNAALGIFTSVDPASEPNGFGHLMAWICFAWLFISLGFLVVTPGRTALHDLISGSYFFAIARRASAPTPRLEDRATRDAPRPAERPIPEARSAAAIPSAAAAQPARRRPPPIPRDARTTLQGDRPFGPQQSFSRQRKNPVLALLLSFFPGLGQIYNGDFMKGFLILLTFWLVFPYVLGILDAYFKAKMINRRAGYLE